MTALAEVVGGRFALGAIAVSTHIVKAAAIGLAMMAAPVAAHAAEVTLLISNALQGVFEELAPRFEKATEHKLKISFGSTNPLKARIEKGEAFDLTILGERALDDLVKQGKLVPATRIVVARSGLGVGIRKGAPKPDIGTTEAFKRTLLGAKSIAFSESGLTGTYLNGLFQRMAIADSLKPKFKYGRGGDLVAKGEAEIGITQTSELLSEAGVEFVGPLPSEIQNYTSFPAAVGAAAKQADAAKALLKYLASPEAAQVIKAKGLEPPA